MIPYGSAKADELQFAALRHSIEARADSQWIDVDIQLQLLDSRLPPDIEQLSALIICNRAGDIVQIVPQDEGRDCEYQFTEREKEQLIQYFEAHCKEPLKQLVSQ